jgi:replication factor C small subunit
MGGNGIKVVIYDEFDNAGDVQMAIRGLMDEVSAGCRFIFTGNYVTKIIEPIQSRTTMIDFSIPVNEKPQIMGNIMGRCCDILDNEGITYNKKVLAEFIQKTFPDFRKILNELQSYSTLGNGINAGILELTTTRYDYLIDAIINKDFKSCEKWTNGNTYDSSIYSLIVKGLRGRIDGVKWMEVVLEADEKQYRHSFAADPDITLWAFCVIIMGLI